MVGEIGKVGEFLGVGILACETSSLGHQTLMALAGCCCFEEAVVAKVRITFRKSFPCLEAIEVDESSDMLVIESAEMGTTKEIKQSTKLCDGQVLITICNEINDSTFLALR